jgi:hypothetical protein
MNKYVHVPYLYKSLVVFSFLIYYVLILLFFWLLYKLVLDSQILLNFSFRALSSNWLYSKQNNPSFYIPYRKYLP